jgi:hypothetical protein
MAEGMGFEPTIQFNSYNGLANLGIRLNQEVQAIIRRSDLWSETDRPETVAALMVVTVCSHHGVSHERIPEELLAALASGGAPPRRV